MLERLLAGVSPGAKRGITVALIAIAWVGFLTAVLAGLVAGLTVIVVGFVACWLIVAMLSGGKKTDDRATEPLLRGDAEVEPDDVQSRVQRRLEAMKESDQTAPPEDPTT